MRKAGKYLMLISSPYTPMHIHTDVFMLTAHMLMSVHAQKAMLWNLVASPNRCLQQS